MSDSSSLQSSLGANEERREADVGHPNIAALARLEAMANVAAMKSTTSDKDDTSATGVGEDEQVESRKITNGCRLAYSSLLVTKEGEDPQALLAKIFTHALTNNPLMHIGGILFYDDKTNAVVQVLEGPADDVRTLYQKITRDPRHTSLRTLWDVATEERHFEGFGMKLGSDPKDLLDGPVETISGGEQPDLLQIAYMSQLTAPTRDVGYKSIEDILRVAVVVNPSLKIGGVLYVNPRTFHVLQVLEGPSTDVRNLYNKIAKDDRHKACSVVSETKVEIRTFERWGMLQGDLADWSTLARGGWMSFDGEGERGEG